MGSRLTEESSVLPSHVCGIQRTELLTTSHILADTHCAYALTNFLEHSMAHVIYSYTIAQVIRECGCIQVDVHYNTRSRSGAEGIGGGPVNRGYSFIIGFRWNQMSLL